MSIQDNSEIPIAFILNDAEADYCDILSIDYGITPIEVLRNAIWLAFESDDFKVKLGDYHAQIRARVEDLHGKYDVEELGDVA